MTNEPCFLSRVAEVRRNSYLILRDGALCPAVLRGSLLAAQNCPVVGDLVRCVDNPYGDALICEILPRRTVLMRPDPAGHAPGYVKTMKEQIMAANFDTALIMTSLNEDYSLSRIARYVAMVLQGGGLPVVVLTKADLCTDVDARLREVRALSESVRAVAISARSGEGLETLRTYLQPGTTIALIGSSGVGKSTLVNTLAGREVMKTSAVREKDDKGRHTTTHRAMIALPEDITLIDTPGMRELGVCAVEEGLDETFADLEALTRACRFGNCTHTKEPGCAVRAALEDGTLSRRRWKMFTDLKNESRRNRDMRAIAMQRRKINKKENRHDHDE